MTELTPTTQEWHSLYQAAVRVMEIAPWDCMIEMDIFGVQNPETDELGFVSVMGRYGEHFAIALYLGAHGLYGYWRFVELGANAPEEMILEMPHLQAMFQDRNVLTDRDRQQIKDLGFKFRGRNAWPMFRSYRPGYVPWYLEAPEVRFLTHALEQTLEIAPRVKEHSDLLEPAHEEDFDILVRTPRLENGTRVWEDKHITVLPPTPETLRIPMDLDMLRAVQALPQTTLRLEMDFFMMPIRIGERGERPYFPYTLLVVDADAGMVLSHELLKLETTREALWETIPIHVVYLMNRLGSIPRQICVRSSLLFELMELLREDLHFELTKTSRLPLLDSAKEFMLDRFL